MLPDFNRNPYQALLAGGLSRLGVDVSPAPYESSLWSGYAGQSRRVDLLHLHWLGPYLAVHGEREQRASGANVLAELRRIRRAGIPIVWTVHNYLTHEAAFPETEMRIRGLIARVASRIIVHSEFARRLICRDYRVLPDKITVIPHGHFRDAYGPPVDPAAARTQLGLPRNGRVFLSFGMVRRYKGLQRLAAVWNQTPALATRHTLVIAGRTRRSESPEPLLAVTRDCPSIVTHLDWVAAETVPAYFGAADVVVLPYRGILTSGALVLAMTYGKPAIAPALEPIVEALGGRHELLYDPSEPDGLRQSLERAAHLDLAPLGRQAAARCDALGWDGIAERTNQVYLDALGPDHDGGFHRPVS